eukprot:762959-Hanusia_phi.AAC.3
MSSRSTCYRMFASATSNRSKEHLHLLPCPRAFALSSHGSFHAGTWLDILRARGEFRSASERHDFHVA